VITIIPLFQILKQLPDLYEIRYERYTTEEHSNLVPLNFLELTRTWREHNLLSLREVDISTHLIQSLEVMENREMCSFKVSFVECKKQQGGRAKLFNLVTTDNGSMYL
jgi:hypothetical protein